MANTFMAGPEYRNDVAGPRPAPRLYMPAKRGSTVQEQTASMVPETDATEYATHFLAEAPRYFITDCWLTKTEMAPAMKKAGMRQNSTCSRA